MSVDLFICKTCGGIAPNTCLKCPDRGDGNGVKVGTILRHLRESPDRPSMEACRQHYGRYVASLKMSRLQDARTMAIILENLVDYRRMCFENGWN